MKATPFIWCDIQFLIFQSALHTKFIKIHNATSSSISSSSLHHTQYLIRIIPMIHIPHEKPYCPDPQIFSKNLNALIRPDPLTFPKYIALLQVLCLVYGQVQKSRLDNFQRCVRRVRVRRYHDLVLNLYNTLKIGISFNS